MSIRKGEPHGYRIVDVRLPRNYLAVNPNMTMAELARQIHVSRQFLYLLFGGQRGCNESTARAVCAVLEVPSWALFVDRDGNPLGAAPATVRAEDAMSKRELAAARRRERQELAEAARRKASRAWAEEFIRKEMIEGAISAETARRVARDLLRED